MDKDSLKAHLKELKQAPVNELNIRRLAEVTTALKNFDMLHESKAMQELEETEDSLNNYMMAKSKHRQDPTPQNAEGVKLALKSLLNNIQESITEIWSLCDTESEKEIIITAIHKLNKTTK